MANIDSSSSSSNQVFASLDDSDIQTSYKFLPNHESHKDTKNWHTWRTADISMIKVRGNNYLRDKKKIAAQKPFAELLVCDFVESEDDLECYSEHTKSYVQEFRRQGDTRFMFVVNYRFHPHHVVAVFAVDDDAQIPEIWRRFLNMNDTERDSRVKVIPNVVDGPWLVKKACGTVPSIIGHKLTSSYFHERPNSENGGYFEVSCNVFSSCVAKKSWACSLVPPGNW